MEAQYHRPSPSEREVLATRLSRIRLLINDFEVVFPFVAKRRIISDMTNSSMLVVTKGAETVGVVYITILDAAAGIGQLHAYFFNGQLRREPVEKLMQEFNEVWCLVPDYAEPVQQWVKDKLGFTEKMTSVVTWKHQNWEVPHLVWNRLEADTE